MKPCLAQTPSPSTSLPFTLPLSDGTTAAAVLLPHTPTQIYLVYATSTGKLGFWTLTQTTPEPTPNPTPTPPPNPTPTPPPPTPSPTAAVFILVGPTVPMTLHPELVTYLASIRCEGRTYGVDQVASPNPPPDAMYWIGRTAGRPYPYAFLQGSNDAILWEGQLPGSVADTIAVIRPHVTGGTPSRPLCPTGLCPINPQPAWSR